MLRRDIYRGMATWNRSHKRDMTTLKRDQRKRPESEWIRVPMPHLQIISADLWANVA